MLPKQGDTFFEQRRRAVIVTLLHRRRAQIAERGGDAPAISQVACQREAFLIQGQCMLIVALIQGRNS